MKLKNNKKGCEGEFGAGFIVGIIFTLVAFALVGIILDESEDQDKMSEQEMNYKICEYEYEGCEIFKCQAEFSELEEANYHLREYQICLIEDRLPVN